MVPSGYLYGEAFYDRSCTSDSRNPYCGSEVWFLVAISTEKRFMIDRAQVIVGIRIADLMCSDSSPPNHIIAIVLKVCTNNNARVLSRCRKAQSVQ